MFDVRIHNDKMDKQVALVEWGGGGFNQSWESGDCELLHIPNTFIQESLTYI